MRHVTEISLNEYGDETHESWLLVRANRVTSSPGMRLFDSEIAHQHLIIVEVTRCTRKRDLHHDWLHSTELLLQMHMSQAQWGAFVSSFGQGGGVPATLTWFQGPAPEAPFESRLAETQREVGEAGEEALRTVTDSYAKVMEAFDSGGKRELRAALRDLGIRLGNAPKNMELAAKRMTEHVEDVVTKARADIEAMALGAMERQALGAGDATAPLGLAESQESAERLRTALEDSDAY